MNPGSDNNRVGFGIIGCGAIAPIHARAIQELDNARLIAVADVVEANAVRLAEQFGVAGYTDFDQLLARDDIQAVCLCVPSGRRLELAEKAAAAGKHILSEKPLEITTDRIDRVIAAADKAGVRLGCVFQSRFAEGPLLLREAVQSGRFGRLVMGDAYIKWHRTREYYSGKTWRGAKQFDGGGALMNQGIHYVDLLLWLMGPVKSVQARTALLGHTGLEVEDTACALLEFESGALGVIEASTAIWRGHSARLEVHGVNGTAAIEDGALRCWDFREEQPEDAVIRAGLGGPSILGSGAGDPLAALSHEGHKRQIQDFASAILEDRPPAVDGREGRHAVALIEAVYESAASGHAVIVRG